jgi:MFS family permease
MTLGAFISSSLAGFVAAKLGRRICLWMACLLCAVANIIMMTTTHIGPLYAGRFLIGLANGYFMTFSQLYIQESSPAKYRGLFLSFFQFCTSFVSSDRSMAVPSDYLPTLDTRVLLSVLSSTGRQPRGQTEARISFRLASYMLYPLSCALPCFLSLNRHVGLFYKADSTKDSTH